MRLFVKSCFYRLAYFAQLQRFFLTYIRHREYMPILSLHSISPLPNPFWPPLKPKIFHDLLSYLKKNFLITTFHEYEHIDSHKPKLILSFDDGYYDFIEYAMPLLKKHHVRVNHNIIPSQLNGEKPLWNIALYDFLKAAPISLIKEISIAGIDVRHIDNHLSSKIKLGLQISRVLKSLNIHEREKITTLLERHFFSRIDDYPKTRMIRLHEMNDIITEHEVGAHSYSHNSMGNESMPYFEDDFDRCRNFFAKHQFPTLDIYAFPNGCGNQAQVEYLRKNNVKYILLVQDQYAKNHSPYYRFNIGAFNRYEAIFQSLGIKARKQSYGKSASSESKH